MVYTEKWATPTFLFIMDRVIVQTGGENAGMKNEFILAFNEVLEEKGLPKEIILKALESAMVSAYRRAVNASNAQHVEAKVDLETGKVTDLRRKGSGRGDPERTHRSHPGRSASYNPEAELGDMVVVESTPRILAVWLHKPPAR